MISKSTTVLCRRASIRCSTSAVAAPASSPSPDDDPVELVAIVAFLSLLLADRIVVAVTVPIVFAAPPLRCRAG